MAEYITQGLSYASAVDKPIQIIVRLVNKDFLAGNTLIRNNVVASPESYSAGIAPIVNIVGYVGAMASIDISSAMRTSNIDTIQSVYIDNSRGAGTLTLRQKGSFYQVTAEPFSQGIYPLMLPKGSNFSFDVIYVDPETDNPNVTLSPFIYPNTPNDFSAGGATYLGRAVESGRLTLVFTNVLMPIGTWNTRNLKTSFTRTTTFALASLPTWTDVLPYNPLRKGFLMSSSNVNSNAIFVWLGLATPASANFARPLNPNDRFENLTQPFFTDKVAAAANTGFGGLILVVKEIL